MTTLTLHIENPSIIPSLRKVLSAIDGVSIAKPDRKSRVMAEDHDADTPNETTMAAMQEIESGHNAGVVNVNSLEDFVSSML